MRFVSKSTNLNVILRPSLPGNPMLGTPATPGLSVRFIDGIVDVKDQDMIDLLISHPGHNQDYISVDDGQRDPYAYNRAESEPDHVITEMQFGQPVARKMGNATVKLPPEMMKIVQDMATQMVKEMLPGAVQATLEAHAKRVSDDPASDTEAATESEGLPAQSVAPQKKTPKPQAPKEA